MSTPITITCRPAAAVFAGQRSRQILYALMQVERSLLDLHKYLGYSLSLLHYHVRKLQQLGLVTIRRRTPRAGRSIAIYAAVARAFIVPAEFDDPAVSAERHAQLKASLQGSRLRRPHSATLYDLTGNHQPRMLRMDMTPESCPEGEWWWRLQLSKGEAEMLSREVRKIVARYRHRGAGRRRGFITYFALARES